MSRRISNNRIKELKKFRKQYDSINNEILRVLKKRHNLSKKIGKFKKKHNMKIIDLKREKIMLENLSKKARKLSLDKTFINQVFKLIIKNSRNLQK